MTHALTSLTVSINEPDTVDAGVTSVCISPDGSLVAAGSLDTVVRIWDVQTGILVERLKGHKDSVYSVAFTPDGRGLVSGSLDKTLKYWDIQPIIERRRNGTLKNGAVDKTSQSLMNFTGHKDYVLSVAVSHDGQWVVSGSKDRGVQFWDAKNAVVQCMLQGHKNSGGFYICSGWTRVLIILCVLGSYLYRSQPGGQPSCHWKRGLASADMCVISTWFLPRDMPC